MANKNCLAGMACPERGSLGPYALFSVNDNCIDDCRPLELDANAHCLCIMCRFDSMCRRSKSGRAIVIRKEYRYFLSGECQVQYKTLQEAIDSAESRVEEFFRKPLRQKLSAKEWIDFMDFVLRNREHIRTLLDFSSDPHQFEEDE